MLPCLPSCSCRMLCVINDYNAFPLVKSLQYQLPLLLFLLFFLIYYGVNFISWNEKQKRLYPEKRWKLFALHALKWKFNATWKCIPGCCWFDSNLTLKKRVSWKILVWVSISTKVPQVIHRGHATDDLWRLQPGLLLRTKHFSDFIFVCTVVVLIYYGFSWNRSV